jgi:hypothetical protein
MSIFVHLLWPTGVNFHVIRVSLKLLIDSVLSFYMTLCIILASFNITYVALYLLVLISHMWLDVR